MYTPLSNIFIPVHRENKMAENPSKPTSPTKEKSRGEPPDPKPSVKESYPDNKKCPMCGESVGLGNDLQLHFWTKCIGYHKKGKDKRKKHSV